MIPGGSIQAIPIYCLPKNIYSMQDVHEQERPTGSGGHLIWRCGRLDTNKPLTAIFEPKIPSAQRLEIISKSLTVFLHSLDGGVITAHVWKDMNSQIVERNKAKQPPLFWEETQSMNGRRILLNRS